MKTKIHETVMEERLQNAKIGGVPQLEHLGSRLFIVHDYPLQCISMAKNNESESDTGDEENFISLPPKTSDWNIHCLESLGIYFNACFHSSPLDIYPRAKR